MLPFVARTIEKAGPISLKALSQAVQTSLPGASIRCVNRTLDDMAVKEQRSGDFKPAWHVKPEFEQYCVPESATEKADISAFLQQEVERGTRWLELADVQRMTHLVIVLAGVAPWGVPARVRSR